ncbi:hypothetical protein RDABS01_013949, partial [Bienertia sinuspersici]
MRKENKEQAMETLNPYERSRMQRVQECKARLLNSGIVDIKKSLTSLVDSQKNEKRKKNLKVADNGDADYGPNLDSSGDEDEEEEEDRVTTPTRNKVIKKMHQRQGGGKSEKRKAPTVGELILKNKQANANRGMDELMAESVNESDEESAAEEHERESNIDADVLDGLSESDEDEDNTNDLDDRAIEELQIQVRLKGVLLCCIKCICAHLKKHEAIILNEFGHPIGLVTPEKDTVGEFSRFLGTIARDYGTAPLLHKTWKLTKYIAPEQKHYYRYPNNKLRWLNRPKRVPDDDFKKFLILWNNKQKRINVPLIKVDERVKEICTKTGPKRFARIREEMVENEDPNKQLPSLAQLFERTRKRQENKIYADTYDDTEAMKNYTPPDDGIGPKDPYLGDMGKEYTGFRRLYGRGVTNKVLHKVASSSVNYVVPDELMDALRADIQNEKTEIIDMRKELKADYERKKVELEANYAKKMEEFDKTKDKMVQDVLEKLISKLPT